MRYKKSVHKSFAMISQVGISMLVPIFLCCMLGLFLENKFGWPLFIPLFILGALAGMRNVYVLISAIYKEDEKKKNEQLEKNFTRTSHGDCSFGNFV